jgi:hypothetical protein
VLFVRNIRLKPLCVLTENTLFNHVPQRDTQIFSLLPVHSDSHLKANTAGPAGRMPCGVGKEHECHVGLRPVTELHLLQMLAVERILILWSLSRCVSSDLLVAVQLVALNVALHPASVHSKWSATGNRTMRVSPLLSMAGICRLPAMISEAMVSL